jgi:hypothetical protein
MPTILFSMPAHENHAVLADAIRNAKKMNGDNHLFMVLANGNWEDFDLRQINIENVYVNNHRLRSVHGNAHIVHHILNFQQAVDMGLEFDYFAVMHTNELFVRSGMVNRIQQADYAMWFGPDKQPHEMKWPALGHGYQLQMFKNLFDPRDLSNYLGNVIEGSWWKKELFAEIVRWTDANYQLEELWLPWAAEECYFPTLSYHLSGKQPFLHPYCAMNHSSHNIEEQSYIDTILANQPLTFWQPHNFVYNYAPYPTEGIFSVKRIDRLMDNPIRTYINGLQP